MVPDPRQTLKWDLPTAGRLLSQYQLVPFEFRHYELTDLQSWYTDTTVPMAVRLMIELAGSLHDDLSLSAGKTKSHWVTGFVDVDTLQRATENNLFDAYAVPFGSDKDVCLVVDYAENKAKEVMQLLQAAVDATDVAMYDGRPKRIRIILIARQRTEIFDKICENGKLHMRNSTVIEDNSLAVVPDPVGFYALACKALNVPDGARVLSDVLLAKKPDCGLLMLNALLAAATGENVTADEHKILTDVLVHESQYWKNAAKSRGIPDLLLNSNAHKVVASHLTFYGLQGAISDVDAGAELISQTPFFKDQETVVVQGLVQVIADLYPHPMGKVEDVGLDLLGDHLVASMCDDIQVPDLTEAQLRSALTQITWIARRDPVPAQVLLDKVLLATPRPALMMIVEMAPAIGNPLGRLATAWLNAHTIETAFATALFVAVPDETIVLREFAVAMGHIVLRDEGFKPDQRATFLNDQSVRLSALGQYEAALIVGQDSVALYRDLAAERPDAFAPDLARSLGAISGVYVGMDDHSVVLTALTEGLSILSPMFSAMPVAFAGLMGALFSVVFGIL